MKTKGFTLIELAIVLVIIGLLIGVGVSLLPGLLTQQKYTENKQVMDKAYNAIIGFALTHGRLPWASDSPTSGNEKTGTNIGYLPYSDLGAPNKDAYSNPFYYAVDKHLTQTASLPQFCSEIQTLLALYQSSMSNLSFKKGDIFYYTDTSQTSTYPVAFILISAGANRKLDAPNNATNSTGISASPNWPPSQTYDDQVIAVSLTQAYGMFCQTQSQSQQPPQTQLTLTPPPGPVLNNTIVRVSGGLQPYTCQTSVSGPGGSENNPNCQATCSPDGSFVTLHSDFNQGNKCTATVTFIDNSSGLQITGTYTY